MAQIRGPLPMSLLTSGLGGVDCRVIYCRIALCLGGVIRPDVSPTSGLGGVDCRVIYCRIALSLCLGGVRKWTWWG